MFKKIKCINLIIILILFASLTNCINNEHQREYYIISTNDSTNYSNKSVIDDELDFYKQCSAPPDELYSQQVILLDSSDVVYLYQTELIKNSNVNCYKTKDEEYQDFIKLKPEHLIRFNCNSFINFIKDNNDIFHFDTNSRFLRLVFIASNEDTIKNAALYDFVKMVRTNKRYKWELLIAVRKTTEEETRVMFCKRNHIAYNPLNYSWPKNSIISKFNPDSKQYDSAENARYSRIVRPKMTYFVDTLRKFH